MEKQKEIENLEVKPQVGKDEVKKYLNEEKKNRQKK